MAKGKYQEWLTSDGLLMLEAWARDGLTDEQVAYNIGITARTLYDWKQNHPLILQALKRGKAVVDIQVENALLKRALGYRIEEVTRERIGTDLVITKKVTKEVLPDVTAQIFWLKNRKPGAWRDKALEASTAAENNLFDAIRGGAREDVNTNDIPELEQTAVAGDDVVEPSET